MGDGVIYERDTQDGAMTNCECQHCRECRLKDEGTHVIRDIAYAFVQGWCDGATSLVCARVSPRFNSLRDQVN